MGRIHHITDWNPDDVAAWEAGNRRVARRNLLCTVAADHVAFSIWTLWPVMALFMPASAYGFTAGDKLLLGAVGALGVGINLALRESYLRAGSSATSAYLIFLVCYVAAAALTWLRYGRRHTTVDAPAVALNIEPARV